MEIMEQLKNQPEFPKLQEIDNMTDDRISALPDGLLIEILSRLDCTEAAIRTGMLSKRWKHVWTSLPNLHFCHINGNQAWSDFISFIDKTLAQCRHLKLKKFEVCSFYYQSGFGSQINNWIRHAIQCNVEDLFLALYNINGGADFLFDEFFFITPCFTYLELSSCMVNPTGPISWKNFRSLCMSRVKLDEDVIENILSGSPVLETLELEECYGFRRIDINSKSVKKLVFSRNKYTDSCYDVTEINAPNILSLTMEGDLYLENVYLVNVSSIIEAKLDYEKYGHDGTYYYRKEEKMLKRFLIDLHHVKELNFGSDFSEILCRLEANEVH